MLINFNDGSLDGRYFKAWDAIGTEITELVTSIDTETGECEAYCTFAGELIQTESGEPARYTFLRPAPITVVLILYVDNVIKRMNAIDPLPEPDAMLYKQ